MENWLTAPFPILLKTVASSLLAMTLVLLLIRFYGLRSLAKMSSADFASTIAIGSILANMATGMNYSLVKGAIGIFFILGFQQIFSRLKYRSDALQEAAENTPVFLMRGSEILHENLAANGVTEADLMAKLREANVIQLSEVKAVVLETTGDVSVLHGAKDVTLEDLILLGVKR